MRKTKIDPDLIRRLVEAGLSDDAIARKMNWTVGTLRVNCSLQKISLRRPLRLRIRRRLTSTITLPYDVFIKLREYALKMHTTAADLAEKLLRTIERDNLYKAVLDTEVIDERSIQAVLVHSGSNHKKRRNPQHSSHRASGGRLTAGTLGPTA